MHAKDKRNKRQQLKKIYIQEEEEEKNCTHSTSTHVVREASIFLICGCCCSVFIFFNFWGRLGTYVFKSHLQPIAKGEKIRRKTK